MAAISPIRHGAQIQAKRLGSGESGEFLEANAMIYLRLASEYLVGPIFCEDLEKMGHIEVDDLPIPEKLKIKIIEWDTEFQATFNDEYPPDSDFCSSDARLRHMAAGQELAQEIQRELGGGCAVKYFR